MAKFLRILLFFSIGFLLIILVIYNLLFSEIFANYSNIIKLRRSYAEFTDKIRIQFGVKLDNFDNYTYLKSPIRIFGINKSDNEYNYGFIGKLENVDLTKGQIYLKCCNNQTYVFNIFLAPVPSESTKVMVDNIPTNNIEFDINADTNRKFLLIWKDKRTLKQILNTYRSDSLKPINTDVFPTLLDMIELDK